MPVSRSDVGGYAVFALVDVVRGWAAECGCDWDAGGEFAFAAEAVAGGVDMPFVSGAGEAMVVW